MDNVIVLPTRSRRCTERSTKSEGVTLFMHAPKTTLIVHLVNPRGLRVTGVRKSGKALV